MKKDVIVALVCLVGSIALYFSLGAIAEERAREFPKVVLIIIMVLSALLLIQSLLMKKIQQAAGKPFPWRRFFLLLAIILVYMGVMQNLGFYVSTFLFFVVVYLILGRQDLSSKKAVSRILISAGFTGVLFVLFNVLLAVQTPKGLTF